MLANCTLADRQHDSKSIQESSDKSETVHSTAIVQFFEKRLYVDVDVDIDLIFVFLCLYCRLNILVAVFLIIWLIALNGIT